MHTLTDAAAARAAQDADDAALAAELTGRTVITRHHPGPVTYLGPSADGHPVTQYGTRTGIWCHVAAVAPADEATIPPATDPEAKRRITAEKIVHPFHKWRALLSGLPVAYGKTKRDVTADALTALAVVDWHRARHTDAA